MMLTCVKEALQLHREALKVMPEFCSLYSEMATTLEAMGNTEEAVDLYNKALSLSNRCVNVYHPFGNLLLRLNRYNEAAEMLKIAIQILAPHSGSYYYYHHSTFTSFHSKYPV
jgi:Tfp pilus assembly protein PilF